MKTLKGFTTGILILCLLLPIYFASAEMPHKPYTRDQIFGGRIVHIIDLWCREALFGKTFFRDALFVKGVGERHMPET